MGLITKEVEIVLSGNNINHFESLGYNIPRRKNKWGVLTVAQNTTIIINVDDLNDTSHMEVVVQCDCCGKNINIYWKNYKKGIFDDDKYYCKHCRTVFRVNKSYQTKLKNGKSFEQWCIDNNQLDILNRWDYELNSCKPSEVTYGSSSKKYYFKCSRGLHKSELKSINSFTNGHEKSILCNQCNSFAQYLIDKFGDNALKKYWDYEKNVVDPWDITKSCAKPKVWIKCQEKSYHESYTVKPSDFTNNDSRCPYCATKNGKVHPLDSLGKVLEDKKLLHLWSDKNKKSPYKYTPFSSQEVWWKCPEGIHEDYYRIISNSNKYDFRCPECQYSKGETKISDILTDKGLIKIDQKDYKILNDIFKEKYDYYILQKEFDGLTGLNGGLLSYDFYIPKFNLNLLIEYQGEQHERYIPGFHKSKKDFEKQLEHDRRKREYAKNNNINLLEIWYYDFDRIEKILNSILINKGDKYENISK